MGSWPDLLVLVRHAESEGNVMEVDERAEFAKPTFAYDLTERGREQARITGEYLRKRFPDLFDTYYTSYYNRSLQTMGLMFPGAPIVEDPRLAEAQRGIFHTMTRAQVAERFPEELRRKEKEGLYHFRPMGGENWPDIELRILSFQDALQRCNSGEKVIIVVHGHWLILFNRTLRHFSIQEVMHQYHNNVAANASVTIYRGTQVRGQSKLVLEEENIVPWKGLI